MSDFAVAGDELKKMLKIAKKRPLPFAYCPGQSPETDLLAIHRKKPGAIMAKALRAEGEGNKIAFGTLAVEGKLVTLQCDRVLPSLAKMAKKFLKFNKVLRNVCVLDAEGNVLEEDVEDLPEEAEDDLPDSGPDEDDAAESGDEAERDEAETKFDPAALVARIKGLEPRIAELGEDAARPLRKAVVEAIGLVKAGDGDRAAAVLDRIEAVLAKLGQPGTPAQPQAGAESLKKLQQAAARLADRVKALPEGDMRAMLANQVRDVVGAIHEGAVERAITGLKQLETDLRQAERNQQQDGAGEPAPTGQSDAEPQGDAMEIWNAAKSQTDTAIGRLQERLKQEGHPDLDRIAEYGLNGITEGNQVALMKRLFEYQAAPSAGRAAAAEKLVEQTAEYRKYLAGNELIVLCEQNPFVTVDIRGPLDAALQRIETVVKAHAT